MLKWAIIFFGISLIAGIFLALPTLRSYLAVRSIFGREGH